MSAGARGATGADAERTVSIRVRLGRHLAHPLFGVRPRRTRLAVAALVAFLAAHLASALAAREIAGVRAQTLSPAFDSLSAAVIAASLVVVLAGPLAYATWNGGPALAFAVPLVPIAFGELLARRYVFDLDAAVAVSAGAAGAALALYAAEARRTDSLRPWQRRPPDTRRTLFVVAVVAGSAAVVARFVLDAPDGTAAAYAPFAAFWLVPAAVAVVYGVGGFRRADASREPTPAAE
ncbi:hypothetical protein [Halovivax sp.]|uniref:hypothetical protein n=1 Tax=Halovivax sp. TaxID=1935978 RepID=UPI0025C4CE44|nr:hypothetical protein [Halovivax sp.]